MDENRVGILIERVQKHCFREEYDTATGILSKAISLHPEDTRLVDQLCSILIETEQFDEAVTLLIKNRGDHWDRKAYELCATAMERSGKGEASGKVIERAFFNHCQSACLYNLKGVLAYQKGDREGALGYLRRSIEKDENFGLALANLGLIAIENGDTAQGVALLKRGFHLSPYDSQVLSAFHAVMSETGEYRIAEKMLAEALNVHAEHKQLTYFYIDILIQLNNYTDAVAMIERAIATFGAKDGILGPALSIRDKIGISRDDLVSGAQSISLCMIVKNEETTLAKCLLSVKGLVDEIIVVDTGSTDHTKEIAKVFGASVYDLPWNDNFSDARNASLSKAKGGWILILDADEQLSLSAHEAIKQMVDSPQDRILAYSFTTRNYCNDAAVQGWSANNADYPEERGGGWYPSNKVRLFPNLASIHFENIIHETVEKSLIREKIKIVAIDVPIHHFGDLDSVKKYRKKERYYQLGKEKLSTQKDNLKCLIENAIQAGEVEDYQRAIEIWKTVLGRAPNYAKGFFNLGYAYIQLGQYKQAMRVTRKAIEFDPELKEAFLNLALCEVRTGNLRNAIQILERFLAHYPNHPVAMGNLGVAHCLSGNKVVGVDYIQRIAGMGFNGRDFIDQHVRGLEIAGQSEMAAVLLSASSSLSFPPSLSGVVA